MDLDSQRTIIAVLLLSSDIKVGDNNKVDMVDTKEVGMEVIKEEEGMLITLEPEIREILTTVTRTILVVVKVVKEELIKVTEDARPISLILINFRRN